ncbi:diiron oxygenase [Nocardia sp. CNY236]|uniref:diiron oxygenase n=1 Tax=Nocardia sp. CNY236 TaxID=1169152 RepID=UPI000402A30C|nr:diiron oxygenase [Nocardia sp. CNY236]
MTISSRNRAAEGDFLSSRTPETVARAASSVLDRLCKTWLTRAAVRNPNYDDESAARFVPELHDFPPELLPFNDHPTYVALDEPIHRRVQALAWVAWNRRVVETEELVVCRALLALMNGETDIARLRRPGHSYRSLLAATADSREAWESDIARLTWAVVGELSIYEFLTIVSNDERIQPGARVLLELHERDEAAHASLIAQVMRGHFHELGTQQRARFVDFLPHAMTSLSQQDWVVWKDVLELAGVDQAAAIVADVENAPDVADHVPLLRSYQRIASLCHDVDIDLPSLSRWKP